MSSCFGYSSALSYKGAAFVLSFNNGSSYLYLIANQTDNRTVAAFGAANYIDAVKLHYDNSTLQIRSLALDLCLDDGGNEALGGRNYSAVITFKPCDAQSINQQFILNNLNQILNPNWPNNNVCFRAYGNQYGTYNPLMLWECGIGNSLEIFSVIYFYCPGISFFICHKR